MKKLFLFLAALAIMLPAALNAQPQIKEGIEEIKNKINGFAQSLAEIKNNTSNLSEMAKNLKAKTEIFSTDFLSPDLFDRLKESAKDLKDRVTAERGGMKKFMGPDLKCSPGSECFKFKKDISEVFNAIENLRKLLLGPDAAGLGIPEKLNELFEQSPGFSLYPVYETMGPWVKTMTKNLGELSKNVESLVAYAKEAGTNPGEMFKGIGPRYYDKKEFLDYTGIITPSITDNYMPILEIKDSYNSFSSAKYIHPDSTINTAITTISLNKLCSKDRNALGFTVNATRETLKFVTFAGKLMQGSADKGGDIGGSFIGHVTLSLSANPQKRLGLILEGTADIINQLLEFAGDNLDKCESLMAQKMITDNQKIINDNLKLLLAELRSN